jgi:hypothetical protein
VKHTEQRGIWVPTQCENREPYGTHRYAVGSPYLTGDTQIHCGQSVPHRRHTDTLCGQNA